MEKFAGYGFNKSHSAAYALLSYQTAYLKAHYPAAFMAAVLSADMDHTDKIVTLIDECTHIDLTVHAAGNQQPPATCSRSPTSAPFATASAPSKVWGVRRSRRSSRSVSGTAPTRAWWICAGASICRG